MCFFPACDYRRCLPCGGRVRRSRSSSWRRLAAAALFVPLLLCLHYQALPAAASASTRAPSKLSRLLRNDGLMSDTSVAHSLTPATLAADAAPDSETRAAQSASSDAVPPLSSQGRPSLALTGEFCSVSSQCASFWSLGEAACSAPCSLGAKCGPLKTGIMCCAAVPAELQCSPELEPSFGTLCAAGLACKPVDDSADSLQINRGSTAPHATKELNAFSLFSGSSKEVRSQSEHYILKDSRAQVITHKCSLQQNSKGWACGVLACVVSQLLVTLGFNLQRRALSKRISLNLDAPASPRQTTGDRRHSSYSAVETTASRMDKTRGAPQPSGRSATDCRQASRTANLEARGGLACENGRTAIATAVAKTGGDNGGAFAFELSSPPPLLLSSGPKTTTLFIEPFDNKVISARNDTMCLSPTLQPLASPQSLAGPGDTLGKPSSGPFHDQLSTHEKLWQPKSLATTVTPGAPLLTGGRGWSSLSTAAARGKFDLEQNTLSVQLAPSRFSAGSSLHTPTTCLSQESSASSLERVPLLSPAVRGDRKSRARRYYRGFRRYLRLLKAKIRRRMAKMSGTGGGGYKSWVWVLGTAIWLIGNFGMFFALTMAKQSLVTALGAVSLLMNLIIAPLINNEKFGMSDFCASIVIMIGSALTVTFSSHSDSSYSLCYLLVLYTKPSVIALVIVSGVLIILAVALVIVFEVNDGRRQLRLSFVNEEQNEGLSAAGMEDYWSHKSPISATFAAAKSNWSNEFNVQYRILKPPTAEALEKVILRNSEQVIYKCDCKIGEVCVCSQELGGRGARRSIKDVHLLQKTRRKQGSFLSESSGLDGIRSQKDIEEYQQDHINDEDLSRQPSSVDMAQKAEALVVTPQVRLPSNLQEIGHGSNPGALRLPPAGNEEGEAVAAVPRSYGIANRLRACVPHVDVGKSPMSAVFRYTVPLAYVGAHGLMCGLSLMLAKSSAELLKQTLRGDTQLREGGTYGILLLLVTLGILEMFLQQKALERYEALLLAPLGSVVMTVCGIVSAGIYFGDFSELSAGQASGFFVGVVLNIFGVFLAALRLRGTNGGTGSDGGAAAGPQKQQQEGEGSDDEGQEEIDGVEEERTACEASRSRRPCARARARDDGDRSDGSDGSDGSDFGVARSGSAASSSFSFSSAVSAQK